MLQANGLRGEVDVTFEGERFVLRPSYEAIIAFEDGTGKGLIQLATAAADGELTLREAACITTQCVRAWGKQTEQPSIVAINEGRIAELILEAGLMNVTLRLSLLLMN